MSKDKCCSVFVTSPPCYSYYQPCGYNYGGCNCGYNNNGFGGYGGFGGFGADAFLIIILLLFGFGGWGFF